MAVIEASVEFDYTAQEADELSLRKGDLITGIRTQAGGWWEGTLVRENRRGMFPDNFVRVLGDAAADQSVVLRKKPGRRCRVLFSYAPANADELALHVDDVIDVLSEVEEGWWRGRLRNRTGVFPSNFVEEIAGESEARGAERNNNNDPEGVKGAAATVVDVMPPEVPSSPLPAEGESQEEEEVYVRDETNVNTVEVIATPTSMPCLPPKPVRERCRVLFPYDAQNEDELSLREEDIVILISREAPDKGWWRGELNGRTGLFPDNFVSLLPSSEELPIKSDKPVSGVKSTTNRIRDSITKPGETTAALRKSLDLTTKKEDEAKPLVVSTPISGGAPPTQKQQPQQKPPPPIKKPSRSPTLLPPTSPNLSKQHSMKFSLPLPPSSAPPPSSSSSSSPSSQLDSHVTSSSTATASASATTTTTVLPVPPGHSDAASSASHNKTQISIPSTPDATSDSHDGGCISRSSGSYSVTSVNCNSQPSQPSGAIVNNHHDSNSIATRRSSSSGGGGGVGEAERGQQSSEDSELSESLERPVGGTRLTHLTANRARAPRRRPPSTIISKEESQEVVSMMNGVTEPHVVEKIVNKISPTPSVPWVEELKMNQAKKNSAAQGKTRVMIGPFSTSSSSTSTGGGSTTTTTLIESTPPSSRSGAPVGVVFRTQRPASMFAADPPAPPSSAAPPLVRNNSTATCNKAPTGGGGGISPTPPLARPPQPPAHPPALLVDTGAPVGQKQWTELVDKVSKLESLVESQAALIEELSRKVKSGQDKQIAMQNEMDKLMELVTQV